MHTLTAFRVLSVVTSLFPSPRVWNRHPECHVLRSLPKRHTRRRRAVVNVQATHLLPSSDSGSGPRSTPPGTRVAKQKPQELALSLSASAHECKYIVVATWSNIVTEAPDRAQNRSSGKASTPRSLRRPGCRQGCLGRAWRSLEEVSAKISAKTDNGLRSSASSVGITGRGYGATPLWDGR